MTKPANWTAATAAEALDLLEAAAERIKSGMRAAYPGNISARLNAQETTPVTLSITLDTSELDRLADERHLFNAQVRGDAE